MGLADTAEEGWGSRVSTPQLWGEPALRWDLRWVALEPASSSLEREEC